MNFTDIFIRRPVLASVVSLMILVLGLRALGALPVLQYPRTQNAVVTVTTIFYGADPDVVAGFITTPLENAIAQANGIDYMSSTSQSGVSTITVYLRLNYEADKALTEINTKISSVLNQLPNGTLQPQLTVKVGQTIDAMYLAFDSTVLSRNKITDYLTRVVQPKLQAVQGVQTVEILGAQNFALRAWFDPMKLAAYGLTAADVFTALSQNDFISGLGATKGQMVQVNLTASTNLHTAEEFADLVLKQSGGAIVRLKDVANVVLGADDYESQVGFDGKQAVYLGIQIAPAANLLDVIAGVRKIFPEIQAQLPRGLTGAIVYDATSFVNSSIREVVWSLFEALAIVTLVVFVFLGSIRSVLIPTVAIPLSLIGAFTMMLMFGFSINLLTLLALVLAIGLVVDDAIIVVENVNRHLAEGLTPTAAAMQAARELGGPIIAMTIVLIAVYVPIGFQSGLTGALFTEFAFTLVGAVTISAVVALTLSPMMSSRLLIAHSRDSRGWQDQPVGIHRQRLRRAAAAIPARAARQPRHTAGDGGVLADRAEQHLFPLCGGGKRTRAARGSGHCHHLLLAGAQCDAGAKAHLLQASLRGLRRTPGDGACVPARHARPIHRRHGLQALGRARQNDDRAATGHSAAGRGDRGRAHRGVPDAAAAGQSGTSRAIRRDLDRTVRSPERRRPGNVAGSEPERHVHIPRHGSQDRQSAIHGGDRSQQGGAARAEDERRRQRAQRDARRRLRELFQPRPTLLQGDSAGAAALAAQRPAIARLLHRQRQRRPGAAVDHRAHQHQGGP